jgi:hypothetical protein
MSISHIAQLYTEMLTDEHFRHKVRVDPTNAFLGWALTDKEKDLLTIEAKTPSADFSPSDNKVLRYLIANQPLGEPVGLALGNAIGRRLGLPVIGPQTNDCDGGCCGWTSRIMFAEQQARK